MSPKSRIRAGASTASAGARWEHFSHDADVGLRGYGTTKAEAFEQAALALSVVVTDPASVALRQEVAVRCDAPDDELLFAEWLNGLIYDMTTRGLVFGRLTCASTARR